MNDDQKTQGTDCDVPEWLTPVEQKVIARSAVRDYESATYLVTTVTPLSDDPHLNTYRLSQPELWEFLADYDDYAEFIVGVARCDDTTN